MGAFKYLFNTRLDISTGEDQEYYRLERKLRNWPSWMSKGELERLDRLRNQVKSEILENNQNYRDELQKGYAEYNGEQNSENMFYADLAGTGIGGVSGFGLSFVSTPAGGITGGTVIGVGSSAAIYNATKVDDTLFAESYRDVVHFMVDLPK